MFNLFDNMIMGFQVATSWENLLFCFLGVLDRNAHGVLPGIGPTTGIAILIPGHVRDERERRQSSRWPGFITGDVDRGSTTSILDQPARGVRLGDDHAGRLSNGQKGRAGPALGMAALASFIAGTFALIMLTLIAPPLASYAVSFGPPEYFALTFMGLTLMSALW